MTSASRPGHGRARNRRGRLRYCIAALLAVVLVVLLGVVLPRLGEAQSGIHLYVFASTEIRPFALQQELESALPGIHVRVFGRVSDLQEQLESAPPQAILARPVVL